MQKADSISSEKPDNPGLDFEHLRSYGIRVIQELTGAFWTDYNEHDPGVTILEQLCYAITDLCYRTDFDIEDHLFNDPGDDTFLKPHQVLPCNPLTVNDYRKLIFDSVFELKNVWIYPLDDNNSSFSGLYRILVDVHDDIRNEDQKQIVLDKTRSVFCNNRSICEDLEDVSVLNYRYVELHADVEVDGVRDAESILAEIFYHVDEYLCPEIRFYSLQELLKDGYSLNDIFNGPLLKHGFIKSSELQLKPDKILISEIIKIFMQVKGVVSVKNLYLKIGGEVFENQVDMGWNELPRLDLDMDKGEQASGNIHFFRGTVNYSSFDYDQVKRQLNELKSGTKRVYRLSEEVMKVPLGRKPDIENYYSVQNHFPQVFGIGSYGLPESEGVRRKAQAKQLKGFLLLFEQILANYLSQLAHVKSLFSLKQDVRQTYFYQYLDSVPDVHPLLKDFRQDISGINENEREPFSYYSRLPQLVRQKDDYVDRRNRFLDYLLALHGESYFPYSQSQFNYYFNDEEYQRHLILNKTRLLTSLSTINKNRARAFNYLEKGPGTENITGMEAKISILLGLGVQHSEEVLNYKAHSLLEHVKEHGLVLYSEDADKDDIRPWLEKGVLPEGLSKNYIENEFDFIDEEEIDTNSFTEEEKDELIKSSLPFTSGIILDSFLRNGIELLNYHVGSFPGGGKEYSEVRYGSNPSAEAFSLNSLKEYFFWPYFEERSMQNENVGNKADNSFILVFRTSEMEPWTLIGKYEDERKAMAAAVLTTRKLKYFNIRSEGLHLVEHILLRPDLQDTNHGILILDREYKPFLRSTGQYTFEERQEIIKKIKPHLSNFRNYSVEATKEKAFEVHFHTPDGKYHFVSLEAHASVDETHERMEKLYEFLADREKIIPYKKKIGFYIKNLYSDRIIPEGFFSYRISIVLPDWTARFRNKEFRSVIENTIHEQKPANVALSCYWLNPAQMKEFERNYYAWMAEKKKTPPDKSEMDMLDNKMSDMLISLKDKCE